ncbi:COG3014 family protein [Desulfurivibrio sp. D14AmB]|uniref:COG3014 family protein n=1 Tax=Desulfurivibrio sp. D14AmB TaxID=3374370 RepID=UPI00376F3672
MRKRVAVGWPALFSLLLVLAGAGGLAGCATYTETSRSLQERLVAGEPEQALQILEKRAGGRKDLVLYLLNKGMLLRLAGDFAASNQVLEEAKELIHRLVAISISEQTAALSVNDAKRSYIGDPYERVLLHLYKTLNYLALADYAAARVEILQADLALEQLSQQERKLGAEGIMRYLSGLVFERAGEWSDALIAYRKAFTAYHSIGGVTAVPRPLQLDLQRLARRQGLDDEVRRYRDLFGVEDSPAELTRRERGEVTVILGTGLAPVRQEQSINVLAGSNARWYRVATPFYPPQRAAPAVEIRVVANGEEVMAALGEDFDNLARRALEAAMPGITGRALARLVVKGSAIREVERNDQLLGVLANIAAVASERADTRSWVTLPARLHLARLSLPPGRYEIRVEWLGSGGRVLMSREYPGIEVQPEGVVYIQDHWIGPWAMERG